MELNGDTWGRGVSPAPGSALTKGGGCHTESVTSHAITRAEELRVFPTTSVYDLIAKSSSQRNQFPSKLINFSDHCEKEGKAGARSQTPADEQTCSEEITCPI